MNRSTASGVRGLMGGVTLVSAALTVLAGAPPAAAAQPQAAASECVASTLRNAGFEEPGGLRGTGPRGGGNLLPGIPGWTSTATDGLVELWGPRNARSNAGVEVVAAEGSQFAELNATQAATLYQDLPTTPGSTITWALAHRARAGGRAPGMDTMQIRFGAPGGRLSGRTDLTDGSASWGRHNGSYVVPAGQTTTRVALVPTASSGGPSAGNFVDAVEVLNSGCTTPCEASALINGGFEQPGRLVHPGHQLRGIPGWKTTASDGMIELWGVGNAAANGGSEVNPDSGTQFLELNGSQPATLFQDVPTVPGSVLVWHLSHRARGTAGPNSRDTMRVSMGRPGRTLAPQTPNGAGTADLTDGPSGWRAYEGTYRVPRGQTVTRFAMTSIASSYLPSYGNFVDSVELRPLCRRPRDIEHVSPLH
ncbi:MAG: hypothetical protein ABIS86_05570 [Streptosporangiaceae bacterium]